MFASSLSRITLLAFLSLCVASPAYANRRVAKPAKTTTTAKQVKRGAVNNSASTTRPSTRQAKTTLRTLTPSTSAPSRSKLVRVSDKESVGRADSAVIKYLAGPLSMRGPKAQRLSGAEATAHIGKTWSITDSRIVANADPGTHPITGNATVVVSAVRARTSKVAKSLNMKQRREFIVNIGTDGKASVVGERSGAPAAKLMRRMNEKLAVSRIVKDVLASSGVRKAGAGMGVLALAVLAGNTGISDFATQMAEQVQLLGPVVMTAAVISAKNGMGRRTTARLHAFEQLTQSFDRELRAGKSITVEAAYSRFQAALKSVKIGNNVTKNVKAPSRENFVKALAAWEAARNTAPLGAE